MAVELAIKVPERGTVVEGEEGERGDNERGVVQTEVVVLSGIHGMKWWLYRSLKLSLYFGKHIQ